jgi:hypothetical protein
VASRIFCTTGLADFAANMAERDSSEAKAFALRYVVTTLCHTSMTQRASAIIPKLVGFADALPVVLDVDLVPGLLKCPSAQFRELLGHFLTTLTPTYEFFEKLRGMLPAAVKLPASADPFFKALSAVVSGLEDKARMSSIVTELRTTLVDYANEIDANVKKTPSKSRWQVVTGYPIEIIIGILNKFNAAWDGLLETNELVQKCVLSSCLAKDDIRLLFEERRDFVLAFIEKNSLQCAVFLSTYVLLTLYGAEALQLVARMRFKAGDALAGDREMAQVFVRVARIDIWADWLMENFSHWFVPLIFSTNSNARSDIKHAIAALLPSRKFDRLSSLSSPALASGDRVSFVETLTAVQLARGRELLDLLLGLLPKARDIIAADFPSPGSEVLPPDSYRAAELLDLIHIVLLVLELKDPSPPLEDFFRQILPHTHPYDAHIKILVRIAAFTGISADLFFALFKPVPFDGQDDRVVQRGLALFDFFLVLFKAVTEVPSSVIDVILTSFIFVPLKTRSDSSSTTRHIITLLIAKNRSAVLTCLDSNFDTFASMSLPWAVVVLEEAKEQRSVIKYWTGGSSTGAPLTGGGFITSLLAVHCGPVENIDKLVEIVDHADTPRDAREAAWRLLEASAPPSEQILRTTVVNVRKLSRKAKLWLTLPVEDRDLFLLIASLNSFKALDLAFDVIRDHLLEEKNVELILKGTSTRKSAVTPVKAGCVRHLPNYWPILCKKKIRSGALIRYGKAVEEVFGREKLLRFFAGFSVGVSRNLAYVTEVLTAPKEKALCPDDLDTFIHTFSVIHELGLDINRTQVAQLIAAVTNPDIIAKLEYPNAPELVAIASSLI